MKLAFEVSMAAVQKEIDEVCFNCQEYKRTASFRIQLACRAHRCRQVYSAYLCKQCLESMEGSEEGGIFFQICPDCAKEILKFKPSTEVPDCLPEDI